MVRITNLPCVGLNFMSLYKYRKTENGQKNRKEADILTDRRTEKRGETDTVASWREDIKQFLENHINTLTLRHELSCQPNTCAQATSCKIAFLVVFVFVTDVMYR